MLIRTRKEIPSSEITPARLYFDRRRFLALGAGALVGAPALDRLLPGALAAQQVPAGIGVPLLREGQEPVLRSGRAAFAGFEDELGDELTPYDDVTSYNNFYEFGTGKDDPAKNSGPFNPRPWTLEVGGLVEKPGAYGLEDFLKPQRLEDRIYRHRCVEAWSMVVPWRGVPLKDLLAAVQPSPSARFVRFETVVRPSEMVGQRRPILDWPYVEGLRLDEALHPLTLMVTGVYGEDLPNQNGAPLRLVVPWKYGFKGVKSIVKMELTAEQPVNTWQVQNSREYGFYANVNPEVDHPRWSQARERRIGELRRRPTLMLNGYADQVGQLYAGMDPRRLY
ncbi:MAG: protein-methionine-sulfoxide reductase catalytic subunit MsrP [Gemmatimonadota bacterium]